MTFNKNIVILTVNLILFFNLFWVYLIVDNFEYFLYTATIQTILILSIFFIYKLNLLSKIALSVLGTVLSFALAETGLKIFEKFTEIKEHAYWGPESDYPFSKSKVSYYQTSWLGAQAKPGQYRGCKQRRNLASLFFKLK